MLVVVREILIFKNKKGHVIMSRRARVCVGYPDVLQPMVSATVVLRTVLQGLQHIRDCSLTETVEWTASGTAINTVSE